MKLLKFSASWCQPCKMLSKTLEGMTLPLEIESFDIDENQQKAIDYGVRGVPTMVVVDDTGKEVKRVVGYKNEKQILEWLA